LSSEVSHTAPKPGTGRGARSALALALVLLATTLVLPLWSTRMEAPQYKGEEALEVRVLAGRVVGDLHEIELLNQYVGVHLKLDTPELRAAPWVLGLLLALVGVAFATPLARRATVATGVATLMAGIVLVGAVVLQYRLYQMGHERSPSIMARIPDFTPPILGNAKIANFDASMRLGAGGWAYFGALLLVGWAARQKPPPQPGAGPTPAS